jgi:hypothetical protein
MNEKIKELALKCYNPYSNFDHEKFAELIVEECNQYALRNWEHGHLLGQDLKIYFGFGAEE